VDYYTCGIDGGTQRGLELGCQPLLNLPGQGLWLGRWLATSDRFAGYLENFACSLHGEFVSPTGSQRGNGLLLKQPVNAGQLAQFCLDLH
jgi:hypothetical protein